MRPGALLAAAASGLLGCLSLRSTPLPAPSWDYLVDAPRQGSRVVAVEATFVGARTERLAIDASAAPHVEHLEVKTGDAWRPVARLGGGWSAPVCARACTLRYRLDLGNVADGCEGHVDCATRVGPSTLSPALAWLLHPTPKLDVPARVRVRIPAGQGFATGLREIPGSDHAYGFRSIELDEGSFTAFGPLRRARVDVTEGTLDVVIVGDLRLAMGDEALRQWVSEAAGVVASLFGRFPVPKATVFVVPVEGEDDVLQGKVLSLAGASVAMRLGVGMPRSATHDDWVLVHELFHLGFPSFRGEGRWLGEGLATYYEAILRARAGWLSEAQLWALFAREMRRGLPPPGAGEGLVHRDDVDSIYWGGALFALLADVALRRAPGTHSLDEVMRATLARGGDATRVWTVADVMKVGDLITRTGVLGDLHARHAVRAEPIDLEALFAELGVEVHGEKTTVRDDRPLASVRRAITLPGPTNSP